MTPKEQKEARAKKIKELFQDFGVYLFCAGGVAVYLFFPDLKGGLHGVTFYLPSAAEAVAGLLVALFAVWRGEKDGNIEGKRKNFSRRAQSAALYGFAVAWAVERLVEVVG